MTAERPRYVGRAGHKLDAALTEWANLLPPVEGMTVADFGSNVGGFVDCLLQRGAAKVYAIDTGYGTLEWVLRSDSRVVTMERTNALHVELPERVDLVTVDVAWTRQRHVLPPALRILSPGAQVVSLVKPSYEAERDERQGGILKPDAAAGVMERIRGDVSDIGARVVAEMESPLRGARGNPEYLWLVAAAQKP